MHALCANHFANGLLGLKELVDIGLGKADGLGKIGNGRLFVAIQAKVFGRCGNDLVSHLVVDRASGWIWGSGCFIHARQLTPCLQFAQRVTVL